jgi:hypothetical protein
MAFVERVAKRKNDFDRSYQLIRAEFVDAYQASPMTRGFFWTLAR